MEKEKTEHYHIKVLAEKGDAPKIIELSDGYKTCVMRKDADKREYSVAEKEGGFVIC